MVVSLWALRPCATPHRHIDHRRCWALARCAARPDPQPFAIEVHRGLLPQPLLQEVAALLVSAFSATASGDWDDDDEELSPASQLAYQVRLMAALQFRGLTEGRQYVTVVARSATASAATEIAGVATISPGLSATGADNSFLEELDVGDDKVAAAVSNMAVAARWRRRGLGSRLLAEVEASAGLWPAPPALFALSVYRNNDPARRLYERAGYGVEERWVDPDWAAAAEKGRPGRTRRQLMIKRVAGWETDDEGAPLER